MPADPTPVFEAATAFWRSGAMFAACDVGVFNALSRGPASAQELAAELGTSIRGMSGLLDACTGMGLLEFRDGRFHNSASAQAYLTDDSPLSQLQALKLQADTLPMWGQLSRAVRDGKPVIPPNRMLGGNAELTRHLIQGMHQRASVMAPSLVDVVDLTGHRRLVDIGGGPGALSVAMLRAHPGLCAQIMDLAPVLEIAEDLIADSGVSDRIELIACDSTVDDFGSGFDAALVSGLLHRMDENHCRSILQKVFAGMEASGVVVVCDLLKIGTGSEIAALFGLQMLLTTEFGAVHTADDIECWLGEVGFKNIQTLQLNEPHPHILVMGKKPSR